MQVVAASKKCREKGGDKAPLLLHRIPWDIFSAGIVVSPEATKVLLIIPAVLGPVCHNMGSLKFMTLMPNKKGFNNSVLCLSDMAVRTICDIMGVS